MATIKDIADKAQVSPAAVSRTLRNDETLSIAPDTRARILAAASELGYVRSESTGSNLNQKSITIIHKHQTFRNQIDSSYYFAVRSGIEERCANKKYNFQFLPLDDLNEKKVVNDGFIIIGNYNLEQYKTLMAAVGDTPTVVVGIVAHNREQFDYVTYSNQLTVNLALEHLVAKGHKKIAYLGIEEAEGTELFGSRKSAFISFMKQSGIYKKEWILESDHGNDRVAKGFEMAKKLASQPELPTAVFCANDPVALGAINGFMECDLHVPDDISIVAHDGSYPPQYSFPPLTTVNVHPYHLGVEAVGLLAHRMKHPAEYSRTMYIYPKLIERKSVKDLSVE